MGLNVDNIFINMTNLEQVVSVLPRVFTAEKWKVAISASKDGWIQLIDSHEETPPNVAQKLSEFLSCLVICAQIYETVGEAGWHLFENGRQIESSITEKPEYVIAALQQQVGSMKPLMFRETIRNPEWKIEQRR